MDILSPLWLQDLIQAYGLWILFTAVMLESMGIPMPGESALVTAALYAASTYQISITLVILVAAAAAIIGDNFGYLIGRTIGIRLIARYGKYVWLNESRLKIGQYLFLQHGGKIVFFGRFVAVLRTYTALIAGINRMHWFHFFIMNALGGICWASSIGICAAVFGQQVEHVAGPVSMLLLAPAIGLIIAGIIFFRHHERELERRAELAFPGPWSRQEF